MGERVSGRIGAGFLGRLCAAFAVTLTLSYLLVGFLLAESTPREPSAADLDEAYQLRVFSNELLGVISEYLSERPREGAAEIRTYYRWVDHELHPRLNDLRQRMLGARIAGPAHTALLAAADRCSAMTAQPDNARARRIATNDVLDAVATAESRIETLRANSYISPGPIVPGFSRYR